VFLNTENISAFVGFSWKIEMEMHGATKKITDIGSVLPVVLCMVSVWLHILTLGVSLSQRISDRRHRHTHQGSGYAAKH
jgi:hypothetical protein